jgi:hypothetical protein
VTSSPTGSFDVFLSYHSGDADWVAALKAGLEAKGLRVWIDSEQIRPGDLFPGTLAGAIGAVSCVVLVLSPGAVASAWVEEEFNLALARRCRVIAALIDEAEPPGFLAGRTWVDFRDDEQFDASIEQLVFGISGRREAGAAAVAVPLYRDTPDAAATADETRVLQRLIDRRRHDARRLWQARIASGIAGTGDSIARDLGTDRDRPDASRQQGRTVRSAARRARGMPLAVASRLPQTEAALLEHDDANRRRHNCAASLTGLM